jgi:transposase
MEVIDESRLFLREAQFAKLKPHLPTDTRGKPRVDDRRVISGIIHVIKSGGRWVDAPAAYGPRKKLCNRFQRWAVKGVWSDIFQATLAGADGPPAQLLIDSSAVRGHRCAAGGTYQIAVLNILQGNVRYSGGHSDPGKCNRPVRSRGQLAPQQARQLRRRSGRLRRELPARLQQLRPRRHQARQWQRPVRFESTR